MARITLDPHALDPFYQQLASALRRQILSGHLQPGDLLPSKRALTQELGISATTVDKATRVLKAEGLVATKMGHGLIVLAPHERGKR